MTKRWVFFVFLLIFPGNVVAGETIRIDSDEMSAFAEHYFSEGEYAKAITEYERFIWFFPNDPGVPNAMYRIGTSHFKLGHFQEAVRAFGKVIEAYPDISLAIESHFQTSDAYLKLGQSDMAISVLEHLIATTRNQDVKDRAKYAIGWIHVEKASWDNARLSFHGVGEQNRGKFRIDEISERLDRAGTIERKNPALAGWLSVIPGGGFLYCERYQDALTAFLLNAGLMLASYESFKDDNYALGSVIGFVGLGFYAGNIYGAVGSAHKYNKAKTSEFVEKLKANTRINISADKSGGVMMSFHAEW